MIFTGHESGKVALFNVKSGEEMHNNERAHGDNVTDLQMSKDRTYCITSSKDKSARVGDVPLSFVYPEVNGPFRYMILKLFKSLRLFRQRLP